MAQSSGRATNIQSQLLFCDTVKSVFKTTSEIGTIWELRAATSVPSPIQYTEMDLKNKTTSEFRTVFTVPWVSLIPRFHCIYFYFSMCDHIATHSVVQLRRRGVYNHLFFVSNCTINNIVMRIYHVYSGIKPHKVWYSLWLAPDL